MRIRGRLDRLARSGFDTSLLGSVLALLIAGCGQGDAPGRDGGSDAAVDAGADAAGDGDADADGDGDADRCLAGGPLADELVPTLLMGDLPGDALHLASDGASAIVCGAGFAVAGFAVAGFAVAVELAVPVAAEPAVLPDACTAVALEGERAVVADAVGNLFLLGVDGASLTQLDREPLPAAASGLAFDGTVALVAAGAAGVLRFETAKDVLSPLAAWELAGDARDVVVAGADRVAVADGENGVRLLDGGGIEVAHLALPRYEQRIIDPDAEGGLREVSLPFEAEQVAIGDGWIAVGCGGYGYVWASRDGDTFGPAVPPPVPFRRPPGPEGIVLDVALEGDDLFYADASTVVRMARTGEATLERHASEARTGRGALDGGWWVSLEAQAGSVLMLATDGLYRAELPPHAPAPELDLSRRTLFVQGEPDAPGSVILQVWNFGDAELPIWLEGVTPSSLTASILGLAGLPGPDPDNPSCLRVPVGAAAGALQLLFDPLDGAPVDGLLTLQTGDPDDATSGVRVRANPDPLEPGEAAPDFALVSIDHRVYRLSEHVEEVVLLKFFNAS